LNFVKALTTQLANFNQYHNQALEIIIMGYLHNIILVALLFAALCTDWGELFLQMESVKRILLNS